MSKEIEYVKKKLDYEPMTLCDRVMLENIIKALTEYEAIKNAEPTKALECLEGIENVLWDDDFHYQRHSKLLDTIKQALIQKSKKEQAWDIVKKKGIDIGWLTQCETVKVYNYHCDAELLTEEEFNLLKEVLE